MVYGAAFVIENKLKPRYSRSAPPPAGVYSENKIQDPKSADIIYMESSKV